MQNFHEFIDKKARQAKKELEVIKNVLEHKGMKVSDHTDDEEPFIYIAAKGDLSFGGIRVYKIANSLAFRVQKEESTHPYGSAYPLDCGEMYTDLLSDKMDETSAGKKVIEAIAEEIKRFFDKSAKAEKDLRSSEIDQQRDPMGRITIRGSGTDYSSMVTSKGTNYGGGV